jgi:hypothetical protein
MNIIVKNPVDCTIYEIEQFAKFVINNIFYASWIKDRVKLAHRLVFMYDDENVLIGTSAIKNTDTKYINSVFNRAGVAHLADDYKIELGWLAVIEKYKGQKLSRDLRENALVGENRAIFSTFHNNKKNLHGGLYRSGFQEIGTHYLSHKNEIVLCVRNSI